MREIDSVNGHFEPASARDEFFRPIEDEVPDLDPIHWARSMGYEVSPEANFRCGREIVEGQFAILKLTRMSCELRLSDRQMLRMGEVLAGRKVWTLSSGFSARVDSDRAGSKLSEFHLRFMDLAELKCAEISCEIEKLKTRRFKERDRIVEETIQSEVEKILVAESALEEITLRNLPFAKYVAEKYVVTSTVPISDLFQAASIGIMTAAARYDFNAGQFINYAYDWAKKEVKGVIADFDGVMRLPEAARFEMAKNLRRIEAKEQMLERPLTDEEMGEVFLDVRDKLIGERKKRKGRSLTREELDQLLTEARGKFFDSLRCGDVRFFSQAIRSESGYGDVEFGDTIASQGLGVEELAVGFVVGSRVRMVINEVLTQREQVTSDLRFGISSGRPLKLADVGVEIGISGEGVRKAQLVAFEKLRADGRLKQLWELI